MDLDMIQDLLGGSNLPPPPSVQDLLSEVVPVILSSPSPPPAPLFSVDLIAEHSYCKAAMDEGVGEAVPMEQDMAQAPGSQTLAQLNSNSDCYEAFLLNLLRVYTQNKIDSLSSSDPRIKTSAASQPSPTTAADGGSSEVFTIDSISPEAINALSQEQVQSLVTSNSTNYDVVHQILAFKQKSEGGGGEAGEAGEKDEAASALQQLQALQLTPEQLKQIQQQMAELIRTKQIVLPAELSVDQQQQLLQSLIMKQIHSQHQQLLAPPSTATTPTPQPSATPTQPPVATPISSTPPSSSASTNTPTTQSANRSPSKATVGSTLAAMLRGDSESAAGGTSGGDKAVKMKVPPPSTPLDADAAKSVALQISTNPVADGSSQTATPSAAGAGVTTRSGGGRKKKDSKDPEEPKKPSSPYGVFFSDVYPSVLQANPRMSFSEASKLISAMWNAMGLDTKKQYHERAEKLKETYQAYLASRKAETTPTEEPVVSPTAVETRTLAEATPTTQQTSQVDLTTGTEPAAEGTAGGQTQSVAPPSAPPPALSTHKLVVKDLRHCANDGCFKDAVYTEFRGPRYCSNECVVQHCKSVFQEWVAQRKMAT